VLRSKDKIISDRNLLIEVNAASDVRDREIAKMEKIINSYKELMVHFNLERVQL